MLIVVIDLLRRFWPTLGIGIGTILFSGLRQATADATWDKIILLAIALLTAINSFRKDSSERRFTSMERTIAALEEENKAHERRLAEAQTAHGETLTAKIEESQDQILKALKETAQSNKSRLNKLEDQVGTLCQGLEKAMALAQKAHQTALRAVAYREEGIQELLDILDQVGVPEEKRKIVEELRALVQE